MYPSIVYVSVHMFIFLVYYVRIVSNIYIFTNVNNVTNNDTNVNIIYNSILSMSTWHLKQVSLKLSWCWLLDEFVLIVCVI